MLDERYPLAFRLYPYQRSVDQDATSPARHPVVIVGGGPIGMAAALDLGLAGTPVLVLDDHEGVGQGSRAICFSKRALEIADRLGCGEKMLDKGVIWNVGKVFHNDRLLYEFNLLPEGGHKFPAFINLPQPDFEKYLVEQIVAAQADGAPIEIRGKNRVDDIKQKGDHVELSVMTPDGPYQITADWVIAADGVRSPVRDMLDLGFEGRVFEDNFLIADVKMTADFPTERWFWFDPHFKSGASALLHKQPNDIWRIDFQLGWDIDREKEMQSENIRTRVSAMLGPDVEYELAWTSIYTFQCRRMDKFRHDRVIFAGDCAHQVSPFGARGANSGVQDTDNLIWKLNMVIDGIAPHALLDSYNSERVHGAEENIRNSTRSTDFITPKSDISREFRDAVLTLAEHHEFARPMVNSGRLSVPCTYDGSPLNSADALDGPMRTRPGSVCPDLPVGDEFLLGMIGNKFTILAINIPVPSTFTAHGLDLKTIELNASDHPLLQERYLGETSTAVYLIRPDQHVVARWKTWDAAAVSDALACALALTDEG